jgi:hypothetical protein
LHPGNQHNPEGDIPGIRGNADPGVYCSWKHPVSPPQGITINRKDALRCVSNIKNMKLRKNIAVSEAGLLFNPVTGESFSVNPIGVEILNLIREEKSQEQISSEILDKYSTDADTFEKDYHDFIGILRHHSLLASHEETHA